MKKLTLILAAFALAIGGFTASTASASPVAVAPVKGDLQVWRVGTDAMGADTYANRNREFVTFRNTSKKELNIAGVLVEDNWAHARTLRKWRHSCNTYAITKLPGQDGAVLKPGEWVTVFNGFRPGGAYKSNNEYRLYANSDRDCGTEGHFYNNNNDTAWVTTATGDELTKRSWDHNGGYTSHGADR